MACDRRGPPLAAKGRALGSSSLMKSLQEICQALGGLIYEGRKPDDLATVFQVIGQDLRNPYLLGYYQSNKSKSEWHKIFLRLR